MRASETIAISKEAVLKELLPLPGTTEDAPPKKIESLLWPAVTSLAHWSAEELKACDSGEHFVHGLMNMPGTLIAIRLEPEIFVPYVAMILHECFPSITAREAKDVGYAVNEIMDPLGVMPITVNDRHVWDETFREWPDDVQWNGIGEYYKKKLDKELGKNSVATDS